MNMLHSLVLGMLQGFTEVLPISSSAHLILLPRLLGWPESGLTFDVALHLGVGEILHAEFRAHLGVALAFRAVALGTNGFPVFLGFGGFGRQARRETEHGD